MNSNEYEEIVKFLKEEILENNTGELQRLKKESKEYEEKLGRLYKQNKKGRLVKVLKKDEIDSVLWMIHNHPTAGHFGVENTYEKIKERFYWKGMLEDIKQYVKYCDVCQRRGKKGG